MRCLRLHASGLPARHSAAASPSFSSLGDLHLGQFAVGGLAPWESFDLSVEGEYLQLLVILMLSE